MKDPYENEKRGFTAKTRLNRQEFGVSWNKKLDKGGLAVSDDVGLTVHIEGKEIQGK
jgi:polyisoprenoid-binding protein YceI